ncbi:MAG: hypothetical protein ACKVP0_21220 [Pirellulaceae bacterium]
MRRAISLVVLFLVSAAPTAVFAQWGNVVMSFSYDGKPPAAKALGGVKPECAMVPPVPDETWIVSPAGDVQNVVVYLLAEKGVKLPIHPSFDKAKGTAVRIDNAKCRFEPRITIKYTNQDLILGNKDLFGHNVNGTFFNNLSFNVLIPAMTDHKRRAVEEKLDLHEPSQGVLACNIHPHMKGYLFIHSHPYSGISDAKGSLTIKNVPQGEWNFVMWHEAGGFIKEGLLGTAKTPTKWTKGRMKIKVGPGVNAVGPVVFK